MGTSMEAATALQGTGQMLGGGLLWPQLPPDPPCLLGHLCFLADLASPVDTKLGSNPVHSTGGSHPARYPMLRGSVPAGCCPCTPAPPGEGGASPQVRGYLPGRGFPHSCTHSLSPVSWRSRAASLSHAALRGTERMSPHGRERCRNGVSTGGKRDSWTQGDSALDPAGTATLP